ncbi:hypothetical protein V8C34DRAFT_265665, partial [Trichoderma compactum]
MPVLSVRVLQLSIDPLTRGSTGVPLLARRQGLSAWINPLPDPVLGQSPEIVSMGPEARGCMSHMPNRHRLRLFP